MKLRILALPILATGLLLGCNPDPRPPASPAGDATPVANNPRSPDTNTTSSSIMVHMNQVSPEGIGASAGTITIRQTGDGLVFTPDLIGLTEGRHGFHIHQNPSCEAEIKDGVKQAAAAAGGHYDPTYTGRHTGPEGDGHKGDLPMIQVDSAGVQQEVSIKGFKLEDLKNRALIVHQQRDDYSSDPAGDSGPPIACGIVK